MKKLKILFYSVLTTLLILVSCTNDESFVEDFPDPQESAALQAAITRLQTLYNNDGTPITDMHQTGHLIFDFCFEFVFPIELIYNNGTTVTVNNIEELITILINQTDELYIVGIEFPFDVAIYNHATNEIEIITIHNEEEFLQLLANCNFEECECPNIEDPVCVEIFTGTEIIIITFLNACFAECEGFTEADFVPCENDCNCTNEYDPVCVKVEGEIIEFQNACFAECEGYTEADFVDCPVDECVITDLIVDIGDCTGSSTYELTINFAYQNPGNEFFDVFVRNNEFIGFFALADLPVTIPEFELSGFEFDYVKVCINDNPDCCNEIEFLPPNCSTECVCPTEYDPVCVEFGGRVITYFNACYAERDGFMPNDYFSCPEACIDCINAPYEPICVEWDGVVLTMYNECFLVCNDFTGGDIVPCD